MSILLIILISMRHFSIIPVFLFLLHAPVVQSGSTVNPIFIPLDFETGHLQNDSFVPYHIEKQPKIGLALSGGGARGFAQIGVLKTFERHGYNIDGIAGTSIGAFIGALYASGYTAAQIESLACKIQWDEIIKDAPPRKQLFLGQKEEKSRSILQIRFKKFALDFKPAYTSGQKLTLLLNDILLNAPYPIVSNFNDLKIPIRIICTDLLSGRKVVLNNGSLADAIRASMAIPLLFTPVAYGDSLLMDGGLVENLPVSEAKNLGVDWVIAVDTSSKVRNKNALKAPWEIADQVTTIMQQEQVRLQMQLSDVSIIPELTGASNTDFKHIKDFIHAGEKAAEAALSKIEAMISKSTCANDTVFPIHTIVLEGLQSFKPDFILSDIKLDSTRLMPTSEIRWIAKSIYQTGFFYNVSARLDTLSKQLIFQVKEFPNIEKITFRGNTVFSDSTIQNIIETKPCQILNFQKGRRDLNAIISLYHKSGFALARIQKIQFQDGNLEIEIDEGRLSDIVLSGNDRTRLFVIFREIPIKKGDLFQVALLKQGLENIYSTGYFEGVRFWVNSEKDQHTLRFSLQEQGYTLFRSGFHFDSERKAQAFIELAEENLFGYGAEGALTGLIGNRDQFLIGSIRADQLFKTFVTARLNLSFQKRDFPYFENDEVLGNYRNVTTEQSILLGLQMRRLGTLSFKIKNEHIHLFPIEGEKAPKELLDIRSITLKSEVDTRDRIPFPRSGKYHLLEYETGASFLGSQVSYFKLLSSMESYYPISTTLVFHPRIRWGTADLTTPFAKLFHLGGMDSFLGFHEDALVGKRFISASGELRLLFSRVRWIETNISFQYDLGGIWGRYSNIALEDFKHSIGLMLSLNTPIGPLQAGWGHNNKGKNVLYFTAGYKF